MPTPVGNENMNVWAVEVNGSLATQYLWGDQVDEQLGRVDIGGTTLTHWTLTDHLGSVRDVIDNSGAVKDDIQYDAYGNITAETNSANRGLYAWTGQILDSKTGLQDYHARWYDASTGKWIGEDPMGFAAGDSNLYRYVHNAPTNATDPSGNIIVATDEFAASEYANDLKGYGITSVQYRRSNTSGRWVLYGDPAEIAKALDNAKSQSARDLISALGTGTDLQVSWDWASNGDFKDAKTGRRYDLYRQSVATWRFGSGADMISDAEVEVYYNMAAQAVLTARGLMPAPGKVPSRDLINRLLDASRAEANRGIANGIYRVFQTADSACTNAIEPGNPGLLTPRDAGDWLDPVELLGGLAAGFLRVPLGISAARVAAPRAFDPFVGTGSNAGFGRLIGWGTGAQHATARTASITLQEIQAAGITRQVAQHWLDFYRSAVTTGRGAATAAERVRLMERVLQLMGG